MWSCIVKLDEEIQQMPVWLRKMVSGPHICVYLSSWLSKRLSSTVCTCTKECNKYDLTAAQCFWLAHHNDSSMWFTISRPPHLFAAPASVLWVGLQKSTWLNFDVKNIFAGSYTEHRWILLLHSSMTPPRLWKLYFFFSVPGEVFQWIHWIWLMTLIQDF